MKRWRICALAALAFWASARTEAAGPAYRITGALSAPDGSLAGAIVDLQSRRLLIAAGGSIAAFDLDLQTFLPGLVTGTDIAAVAAVGAPDIDAAVDRGGSSVTLFGGRDGNIAASIRTGGKPSGAYFDQKSGILVLVDSRNAEAIFVDPANRAMTGTLSLEARPADQITGDGNGLVFLGWADGSQITVLDPTKRTVARRIPLHDCHGLTGIGYDDEVGNLLVACEGGLQSIAPATGDPIGKAPLGKIPGIVLLDGSRNAALVPSADGTLSVVAIGTDTLTAATVRIPEGIRNGAVDPVTGRVFLLLPRAKPDVNQLLVLDPA